jgi:hypothetical protein
MKKVIAVILLGMIAGVPLAHAKSSGISLYGFDAAQSTISCGTAAGLGAAMTSNCGSIGREFTLVSSVVVPRAITQLAGLQQLIEVEVDAANVPDYWRFDACRGGKITPLMNNTVPADGVNCIATIWDYNAGSSPISVDGYNVSASDPARMQLNLAGGVAAPFDVPFDGNELAVASLQVAKGPTSCAGCALGACIVLRVVLISEDGVLNPLIVTNPSGAGNVTVTYQTMPGGLACHDVPTRNKTWGGIKALYR